jgi:putative transposase
MPFDSFKHHRRSIRIKDYDYTQAGMYFVTIVTHNREHLFGEIQDGEMHLSQLGRITNGSWARIAQNSPRVQLDEFIIMPNHVHGILVIGDDPSDAVSRGETREQFGKPVAGSLPSIVRSFKSVVTRLINDKRRTQGAPVWQRNYYEHIIRNQDELERVRAYIAGNPACWTTDQENPQNAKRI